MSPSRLANLMRIASTLFSVVNLLIKNFTHVKDSLCLTKHPSVKTYWGSGGIAPRILDLGTRWRWVVNFTPQPLYPQGKIPPPRYPLDRSLGGPQSRSGRSGEERTPRHRRESNPIIPCQYETVQKLRIKHYTVIICSELVGNLWLQYKTHHCLGRSYLGLLFFH
jgi:hypothetical protein